MVREGQKSVRSAQSVTCDLCTAQPFFLRCKLNRNVFKVLKQYEIWNDT